MQNNLNNIKYYTHSFVVLNNDLTIYGYTKQFNFEKYLVEFCIGMTTRNNNFIITYNKFYKNIILTFRGKNIKVLTIN